jgi:hypothetical protein
MPKTMPSDSPVNPGILGPFLDPSVDRALGIGENAFLPTLVHLLLVFPEQFPYILWQSAHSMAVLLFIPKYDIIRKILGLQIGPLEPFDLGNPSSELEPD